MEQGSSRIATVPVSSLSRKHLFFEPQTITVVAPGSTAAIAKDEPVIVASEPLPTMEHPKHEPVIVASESQPVVERPQSIAPPQSAEVFSKTVLLQPPSQPQVVVSHESSNVRECWPSGSAPAGTATSLAALHRPLTETVEQLFVTLPEGEGSSQIEPASDFVTADYTIHAEGILEPVSDFAVMTNETTSPTWPGPRPKPRTPAPSVPAMAVLQNTPNRTTHDTRATFHSAIESVFASEEPIGLFDQIVENLRDLAERKLD
jgi:hypothetical protein